MSSGRPLTGREMARKYARQRKRQRKALEAAQAAQEQPAAQPVAPTEPVVLEPPKVRDKNKNKIEQPVRFIKTFI